MNSNDINELKNNYKKICNNVLKSLCIIILIILIYIIYNISILKNIFNHNVGLDISKNSKVEYYYENRLISTTYFKDGVIKMDAENGEDIDILVAGEKWYSVNNEKKQYMEISEIMIPYNQGKSFSSFGNGALNSDSYDSFFDVIKLKFENDIRIKSLSENGKEYWIIEIGSESKMWVDKETLMVEKELNNGVVSSYVLKRDVVTDEDMKMPWDKGDIDIKQYDNK